MTSVPGGNASSVTPGEVKVEGGVMSWNDARTNYLTGTAALWQDPEGLHLGPIAPGEPAPPTSILWAWSQERLMRIRLDGENAFVACIARSDAPLTPTFPWRRSEGRVASVRFSPDTDVKVISGVHDLRVEQVVVPAPPTEMGKGSLTFVVVSTRPEHLRVNRGSGSGGTGQK